MLRSWNSFALVSAVSRQLLLILLSTASSSMMGSQSMNEKDPSPLVPELRRLLQVIPIKRVRYGGRLSSGFLRQKRMSSGVGGRDRSLALGSALFAIVLTSLGMSLTFALSLRSLISNWTSSLGLPLSRNLLLQAWCKPGWGTK